MSLEVWKQTKAKSRIIGNQHVFKANKQTKHFKSKPKMKNCLRNRTLNNHLRVNNKWTLNQAKGRPSPKKNQNEPREVITVPQKCFSNKTKSHQSRHFSNVSVTTAGRRIVTSRELSRTRFGGLPDTCQLLIGGIPWSLKLTHCRSLHLLLTMVLGQMQRWTRVAINVAKHNPG